MTRRYFFAFVSMATLLNTCTEQQQSTQLNSVDQAQSEFTTQLNSLFESLESENSFMGSLAVRKDGQTIYSNSIGFENIEANTKATSTSSYRIGSISKTYTAALVLKAVDEKKLALNQTLDRFFPNIKNAKTITIQQMLNHQSGIYSYTRDRAIGDYHTTGHSNDQMIDRITNYESRFEPGTQAEYSNSNYFLLTLILEEIYQKSYAELVQENIAKPLKASHTFYGNSKSVDQSHMRSYKKEEKWNVLSETDMSVVQGAGGIVSSANDVAQFMDGLFNQSLISSSSLDNMTSIEKSFGLGINRFTLSDRTAYGHHGSIDGFKSVALHFPEQKLSIALLSNASSDNKDKILKSVITAFFNDDVVPITEAEIDKFVGIYQSQKDPNDRMKLTKDKNALVLVIKDEFFEKLIYKGNNRFIFEQAYAESMIFSFSEDGKQYELKQGEYASMFVKR